MVHDRLAIAKAIALNWAVFFIKAGHSVIIKKNEYARRTKTF